MITLMLTALMGQDKVAAVAARYEAAMNAMPCFEVKAAYVNPLLPAVKADIVFDRNARLWYHAVGKGANYILSIDPADGYREIDFVHRIYDQYYYRGNTEVGTSRITPLCNTVPQWLHAHKLQNLLPHGVKFTYVGQLSAANGVQCDHLHAKIEDQMGTATLDLGVMPNGLVAEYSSHVESRMTGNSSAKWSLSDYRRSASFPESKFANPIPDRFVPYALDQGQGPVAIPATVTLGPWVDSRSGRRWSPPAGKAQLIVIAGQDSPPSDRAIVAARGWRSALAAHGVQLVLTSDASKQAQASGLLFDPTQKNVNQLQPMSTPLFVLVDSKGKVRNLWLGFESSGAGKMLADIQQAAAEAK